jgi:tetratricopeptide (TPR) repeat protein
MSKPMMVTLPFVLMLLDCWPLYRWKKALYEQGRGLHSAGGLILEKVPFILLMVISSILTLQEQNEFKSLATLDMLPIIPRLSNVIVSYGAYLGKILWPFNLAAFYPYNFSIALWKVIFSGFIITVITIAILYKINKHPFLFTGWFWYLITFIPLSGLIQAGMQAMADRHTYLPFIGIAIIMSWGISSLFPGKVARRKILFPAGVILLIFLSVLTWRQCGYWKNSVELWRHTLQATKNNYVAYNLLGVALSEKGKQEEAVYYYDKAISVAPLYAFAYNNRGVAYIKLGKSWQIAVDDFTKAIDLRPDYADAFNNRAIIYFNRNDIQKACPDARKACSLGVCTALKSAENRGYFCR